MLNILFGIIGSYLIGSIPTSYLIGRLKGVDVRKQGSGNVGATNVLRAVGKLPALITLLADIGKGIIAVTLIASICYNTSAPINFNIFRIIMGLSVIIGHNWSVFLRFKGGKGVATSCGVFIILLPKAMGIAAAVWLLTFLLTRYVSLSSILLAISVPISTALMGEGIEVVVFSVTICLIISYKHKDNILRLLRGTENKIRRK